MWDSGTFRIKQMRSSLGCSYVNLNYLVVIEFIEPKKKCLTKKIMLSCCTCRKNQFSIIDFAHLFFKYRHLANRSLFCYDFLEHFEFLRKHEREPKIFRR